MSILSLFEKHLRSYLRRQTQFSDGTDFEGIKNCAPVLNIGRHCMISSVIRKIEKGKGFLRKFGNFVLSNSVKLSSVNLDRETTCLTRPSSPVSAEFSWVEGELSQVQLLVENLLPADLRVMSVSLLADGSAMDVFPSQLTLAAHSGQHAVNLVGAPQEPGQVTITGQQQ